MTFPIQLVPAAAPEGGSVGTTPAVPTGAEAAAIATEFRQALSSALGTRPRRLRGEGEGVSPATRGVATAPAEGARGRPAAAEDGMMRALPTDGQQPGAGAAPVAEAVPDVTMPPASGEAREVPVEAVPAEASTWPGSADTSWPPAPDDAPFVDAPLGELPDAAERDEAIPPTAARHDLRNPNEGALLVAPGTAAAPQGVTPPQPAEGAEAAAPAPALVPAPASSRELERRAAALLADPAVPIRDRALLRPEFGTRLDRVIERMETEFGYTVEVVETHRTQQRQDTLFAQGRTAPGPIVTWTRDSKHADGLAADVVINGGWSDRGGFERLARVAREEGLRTLWPRDPGHIELAPSAAGQAVAGPRQQGAGVQPADGRVALPTVGEIRTLPGAVPPHPEDLMRTLPADALFPSPADGLTPPRMDMRRVPFPLPGREHAGMGPEGRSAGPVVPAPHLPDAGVAVVAPVATVAAVAEVARVAQVAVPGAGPDAPLARVRQAERREAPRQTLAEDLSAALTALVRGSDDRPQELRGESRPAASASRPLAGTGGAEARPREQDVPREELEGMLPGLEASTDPSFTLGGRDAAVGLRDDAGVTAMDRVARTDAAERIARALRLQDSQADLPMSSVTLRLDHPEGGEDRIRVDLRGASVGARLDIADPVAAEQVRLHANELRQALESRGLDGDAIAVRAMTRTVEGTSNAAVAASGEREGLRAASAQAGQGSSNGASRDSRQQARSEEFTREHQQPSSRQPRDQRGTRR